MSVFLSDHSKMASWGTLLRRIQTVCPTAYLAGGALRDLDNGRPVKDLDVFIAGNIDHVRLLTAVEKTHRWARQCPGQYIDAAKEVVGTYTFDSVDGLLPMLNVITLVEGFDTRAIINRVDFGICQIGFDGGVVTKTGAYMTDKRNHQFTLLRAESHEGVLRSIGRHARLTEKYPSWPLVIPPQHLRTYREATWLPPKEATCQFTVN